MESRLSRKSIMLFVSLGLLGEMIARPQRKATTPVRARLGCAAGVRAE